MPTDAPSIDEIVVGDEPDAWRSAGFAVDPDGVVRVGRVRVRLVGRDAGKGIRSWSLRGIDPATTDLDGLPTTASQQPPAEPAEHPCGATSIDHVVVLSPNGERTAAAVTAATGLEVRRVRDTDSYGAPMKQRFFRLGEALLELVSIEPPTDGTVDFFGLALTVSDLDALPALLGDGVGEAKDAVQPGRRITALRNKTFGVSVPVVFMSPEPT